MEDRDMYEVTQKAVFDESTEAYKYTIFYPNQGSDLNGFSDLRIHVQGKDYHYHVANAYIVINGQLKHATGSGTYAGTEDIAIINNGPLYLFSKMTFRIAGRDIESVDFPGQTTSMILHSLFTAQVAKGDGLSMGWFPDSDKTCTSTNTGFVARKKYLFEGPDTKGKFSFRIPLKNVFGVCSDYDRVIFGYDLELVLIRQNDYFALFKKEDTPGENTNVALGKLELKSITLHMPVVTPAVGTQLKLLEIIKNKLPLTINFRERCGQSIDIAVGLTTFDWQFSTISLPKRPKYVFIGFQDQQKTNQTGNYGLFTNANVARMSISVNNTMVRLHEQQAADFSEMEFTEFYRSFLGVRQNLFGIDDRINISHISPSLFKDVYSIFAFDLSKYREQIVDQTVSTILHVQFGSATTKALRCFVCVLCDKEVILQSDGKSIALV